MRRAIDKLPSKRHHSDTQKLKLPAEVLLADLNYQCPYKSREGHGPSGQTTDFWVYHHILPVRYYWCTAFIVVKLIRLLDCDQQGKNFKGDIVKEFGIKNINKGEQNIGEAQAFCKSIGPPKKQDLIQMCKSLHRSGGQNVETGLEQDLSNSQNIVSIVNECTGPKYGGFAGMKGSEQRSDDPEWRIEPNKPVSFTERKWDCLVAIGNALKNSIPEIVDNVNGPYQCNLKVEDALGLIHNLRILKHDYNQVVNQFQASDWVMNGAKAGWYYFSNPALNQKRAAFCGKIFRLAADGEQGGVLINRDNLATVPRNASLVSRGRSNDPNGDQDDNQRLQFIPC
jgi:hypothetical protein